MFYGQGLQIILHILYELTVLFCGEYDLIVLMEIKDYSKLNHKTEFALYQSHEP